MTPDQFKQLATDIAARFPTETAASDASAAQAVAVGMNALTQNVIAPIPYEIFQPALMQMQCWGTIRVAIAKGGLPDQVLALCFTAVDLLTIYKGRTVDTQLPAFVAAMAGLLAANLMTADEQAAIAVLAAQTTSYIQTTYGVPAITAADVLTAWGKPTITQTQPDGSVK